MLPLACSKTFEWNSSIFSTWESKSGLEMKCGISRDIHLACSTNNQRPLIILSNYTFHLSIPGHLVQLGHHHGCKCQASDYESITPWSQLQRSNQVNTNPSRIALIIVMNIYIIKWVISHALPSYITGCMQTHLFQTSFTGMGCSFFGAFIRRGLYLWQTWHVSM